MPTPKHLMAAVVSCVGLVLVATAVASAQTSPLAPIPPADTQYWTDFQLQIPVTKKVELNLIQIARFGSEDGFRSDTRTGVSLNVRVNKYFSFQPTYVYQYAHPGGGRKNFAHRLFVDSTLRIPLGAVSLPNRIRIERVVRHDRNDLWLFRVRPGVEIPVKLGGHHLTLFANNELYYDTSVKAWTRNRLITGVSRKVNQALTMEFFYLHQNDGFVPLGDLGAFGVSFRIKLRNGT